jgi:hypothetical protein
MHYFRKPNRTRATDIVEPLPVGVAMDADWADWEDSVAFQESLTGDFRDTEKQPISPPEGQLIDAFFSVTRRCG